MWNFNGVYCKVEIILINENSFRNFRNDTSKKADMHFYFIQSTCNFIFC